MFSIIINVGYYKNLALDTVDFRVSKINLLFTSNIYIIFLHNYKRKILYKFGSCKMVEKVNFSVSK